jgi:hypothetical protein
MWREVAHKDEREAQRESTVDSTCFFTIAVRNPKNKVELARKISGYFFAVSALWHIICQQVAHQDCRDKLNEYFVQKF